MRFLVLSAVTVFAFAIDFVYGTTPNKIINLRKPPASPANHQNQWAFLLKVLRLVETSKRQHYSWKQPKCISDVNLLNAVAEAIEVEIVNEIKSESPNMVAVQSMVENLHEILESIQQYLPRIGSMFSIPDSLRNLETRLVHCREGLKIMNDFSVEYAAAERVSIPEGLLGSGARNETPGPIKACDETPTSPGNASEVFTFPACAICALHGPRNHETHHTVAFSPRQAVTDSVEPASMESLESPSDILGKQSVAGPLSRIESSESLFLPVSRQLSFLESPVVELGHSAFSFMDNASHRTNGNQELGADPRGGGGGAGCLMMSIASSSNGTNFEEAQSQFGALASARRLRSSFDSSDKPGAETQSLPGVSPVNDSIHYWTSDSRGETPVLQGIHFSPSPVAGLSELFMNRREGLNISPEAVSSPFADYCWDSQTHQELTFPASTISPSQMTGEIASSSASPDELVGSRAPTSMTSPLPALETEVEGIPPSPSSAQLLLEMERKTSELNVDISVGRLKRRSPSPASSLGVTPAPEILEDEVMISEAQTHLWAQKFREAFFNLN